MNLSESDFNQTCGITDIFIDQISKEEGYYQEKCFLNTLELLINSIAAYKNTNIKIQEKKNDSVRQFKFLVKCNLRSHCDVTWYAEQMSLSTKSLVRLLKEHLNVYPKDYIVTAIIKDIKISLIDSSFSIKDILSEYCYSHSQLHRQFKDKVGFTMSEYRSYNS